MDSPCHHDCTDFTDDPADDAGCCTPLPVRRECGAPVLPVPECDEEPATLTFNEETEQYSATVTMYDNNCSAWLDVNGDPWLAIII